MDLREKRLRFDALFRAHWGRPPADDEPTLKVWYAWLDPLPPDAIERAVNAVARDWGTRPGRPGLHPFRDAVSRGGHSPEGREYDTGTDSDPEKDADGNPRISWAEYRDQHLRQDFADRPDMADLVDYLAMGREKRRQNYRYARTLGDFEDVGQTLFPGLPPKESEPTEPAEDPDVPF